MEETNLTFAPYTLSIKDAGKYFGVAPRTIYNWVSEGRLQRGQHYLKLGWRTLIIREALIKWLEEQDGSQN